MKTTNSISITLIHKQNLYNQQEHDHQRVQHSRARYYGFEVRQPQYFSKSSFHYTSRINSIRCPLQPSLLLT